MSALPENPLLPIPIHQYREGNTGVPYAFQFDSGKPGPTVGITALIPGNEVCGAHALDLLLRETFRPARRTPTMTLGNVASYSPLAPNDPTASRFVPADSHTPCGPNAPGR